MGVKSISFNTPTLRPPRFKDGMWALAADFVVEFQGEVWRVPSGFFTDGASIPRPLWWLCGSPLQVPRLYAAIIHDFIYGGGDDESTRAEADDIFRDIQIACRVPRWKAYIEWAALRLFGRSHWQGKGDAA